MGENRHFIEFLYKFQGKSISLKTHQTPFISKNTVTPVTGT